MNTSTSVPVIVQPEALAYADKPGLRPALERMVERMQAIAPHLVRIGVSPEASPYDPTDDPQVVIEGVEPSNARLPEDLTLLNEYRKWVLDTYPPTVTCHFVTHIWPGTD